MSGRNSDQLHHSTLRIYSSLMEEFNPSLQKLASLGNSYIQAFQALAARSEAYFSALSKIGESALRTMSSNTIGDILIQISESQRILTMELERLFSWFSVEVLQQMENNVRLDKSYIADSRKHYEMQVQSQAMAVERQRWRGGSGQDYNEYLEFLRRSHDEAMKEEERRHRFLAEKHCTMIQSIAHLMNKTGRALQQRTDAWKDEVNATREPESRRTSVAESTMGMKEESGWNREEPTLGKVPSRAPSPQGSISRLRADSAVGGGGVGGVGRTVRALVDHAGSTHTSLAFSSGEVITVLVQEPRNGWLYGAAERSGRKGWFPASYVEAVDDPPILNSPRPSLWSNGSMGSLIDHPMSRQQSINPAPPPPPPPPSSVSNRSPEVQPAVPRAEPKPENKRSNPHGSPPELFPRGTNPFATVKLRPTSTNDRSAPHFNR